MNRPSRLSGLWMCTTGTLAFAVVYGLLEPEYHWTRFLGMSAKACPNYGAAGNASPFGNSGLDILLLLAAMSWLLLVVVEQALPISWRNRNLADYLLRAAGAVGFTVTFGCCFPFQLALVCH